MRSAMLKGAALLLAIGGPMWCQTAPLQHLDPQPIYRVTVVSRTLPAVNYEHQRGPTVIGFRGHSAAPQAKGDAMVESKRGRVVIDAKFEHLEPPLASAPNI